jgi:hypothetical protein
MIKLDTNPVPTAILALLRNRTVRMQLQKAKKFNKKVANFIDIDINIFAILAQIFKTSQQVGLE